MLIYLIYIFPGKDFFKFSFIKIVNGSQCIPVNVVVPSVLAFYDNIMIKDQQGFFLSSGDTQKIDAASLTFTCEQPS